ncbi:ATP-binding protein [Nonomuraea maritima]|uniref:ATP-binding protein n=1 Tax=Nonomuraea maritima TaxID=683260 RepID=UPI00371F08A9
MNETEERALRAVSRVLTWATTAEHAWNPPPFHVDAMHPRAERLIAEGIEEAAAASRTSPLGVVIEGEGGAGKTHLLGWVRGAIAEAGGYFFLVDFSAGDDFWKRTAGAMVEDLGRPAGGPGAPIQAMVALRRLADLAGVRERVDAAVDLGKGLDRDDLDALVNGLLARDRGLLRCRDTIRALALYAAATGPALDVAFDHLMSTEEAEEGDRQACGMSKAVKAPHEIAVELSTVLAMTGPSVIAVDQIDAILQHSRTSSAEPRGDMLDELASGLMALVHATRRTLCLVACLPSSWTMISKHAIGTVRDRFRKSLILTTIATPDIARTLVERRFAVAFSEAGWAPPSPCWPIATAAFDTAPGRTPRTLLRSISAHVETCLAESEVRLLERFDLSGSLSRVDKEERQPDDADLARLDARFTELLAQAEVSGAFDPAHEDELAPALLAAGLRAWVKEQGDAGRLFSVDPLPGRRPALHARLRQALAPDSEEQRHWTFRVIGARHHAAALKRLADGMEASGLGRDRPDRCFVVLRNQDWSDGPATRARMAQLKEHGGQSLTVRAGDLRVFEALRLMMAERDPEFDAWLRSRRPAGGTELLTCVLGPTVLHSTAPPERAPQKARTPAPPHADAPAAQPQARQGRSPAPRGMSADAPRLTHPGGTDVPRAAASDRTDLSRAADPGGADLSRTATPSRTDLSRGTSSGGGDATVSVGRRLDTGADVELKLSALTRHTAVFAGSGSGKTVFLRRLVEECALHGVSSIVLDSNNDLARLGDPWPVPPAAWGEGDAVRAARYFAGTDVVIWTPGRSRGRPLSFQPLPDFAAVRDDPDELQSAIGLALEALAPRAAVSGAAAKARKGKAVLREALEHFARAGGRGFPAFLAMLGALPFEASQIDRADVIAAELGQLLRAATITDSLFAGDGEPVDPAQLLTPAPGRRARVSVISFAGLDPDARPGFVNQLQMALFSWIKRHPARDRPLKGLYVMDEAQTLVSAASRTEALASTLTLASQARKYGLGLVFATQAPRGLHNQIAGNATTQFVGRLNSPTQITVVQELARARGGRAERVGRLEAGQFYAASDGVPEVLLRTPQCLSHHPADPLTEEEIIRRASR